MKISKSEKKDCKKQKRIAEVQVEKLALNIDRDLLDSRAEQYIKELKEPLCDRCVFRIFELQKQIILNEQLKGTLVSEDRKPEKKLFGRLVVERHLQCSFCFSKVFISEKHFLSMENTELLLEKSFALKKAKEAKEKKMQIFYTMGYAVFIYLVLTFLSYICSK